MLGPTTSFVWRNSPNVSDRPWRRNGRNFVDKQATYDEEHQNKKHVLTDEERKRIEESRKRALKLKEEKQAKKKQKLAASNTTVTPSPYAKFGSSKSPPVNPYANNKATPSSAVAASPSGTTSTSEKKRASRIVHITPPSAAKPSSPLVTPTSHSPAAATAPAIPPVPCARCGLDYDDTCTSLCIVWTHKGEIHRQRGYNGWDQFKYDCRNRLDPFPCYVGRHVLSSGRRSSHHVNVAVNCNCGSRATIR